VKSKPFVIRPRRGLLAGWTVVHNATGLSVYSCFKKAEASKVLGYLVWKRGRLEQSNAF